MTFKDLKFKNIDIPNGIQALVDFGKYHLSIVKHDFSYGGKAGLYEIATFNAVEGAPLDMVELPGITAEGDTVKGYLTEANVDAIMLKLYIATGTEGKQI